LKLESSGCPLRKVTSPEPNLGIPRIVENNGPVPSETLTRPELGNVFRKESPLSPPTGGSKLKKLGDDGKEGKTEPVIEKYSVVRKREQMERGNWVPPEKRKVIAPLNLKKVRLILKGVVVK